MKLYRILLVLAAILLLVWYFRPGLAPQVEAGSVLVLDVDGQYVESPEPPLLARLMGRHERPLASLLSELAKAERDDRLAAVILRIRGLDVGWGKAQEIRDAIARLGEHGRHTLAYLELESFSGNLEYYVASAAQEVYASPASRGPLVGLAGEYLFLGGLFDKLGVDFEVERVGRYKTAVDTIAGHSMTEAHREMANSLLDSLDAQFVSGLAKARKLSEADVRRVIAGAAVEPDDLARAGLVDGVLPFDELAPHLGGGPLVRADAYRKVDPESVGFDPVATFALVYGSGGVVTGEGRVTPSGAEVLASDTVSKALEDAAEDSDVAAIVFRIDSPGGSALASDIVWRAVQKARASGKPVIASLSDVAASGGYYIASGADAIVASPGTITGSIGVFALRPVLTGLYDKVGIGVDSLTRGPHADLTLSSRSLSPETRALLRRDVESIYDLFVERVSTGRKLGVEAVDEVGRGRVWTGAQALDAGLVDELGGLRAAVQRAKAQLDLAPDADVSLVPYPRPTSLLDQLGSLFRNLGARALAAHPAVGALRELEPWLRAARDGGVAALLPFSVRVR